MAFFSLEDRYGEMECIAFARVYAANEHLIRTDSAISVQGTLSLREDEAPKLLVNRIEALVDDASFSEEKVRPKREESRESKRRETREDARERTASATEQPAVPENTPKPRRLFLRVPSMTDEKAKKARNLAELFDGDFPLYFYDAQAAAYAEPIGIALSGYVLGEFRALLGDENVILK